MLPVSNNIGKMYMEILFSTDSQLFLDWQWVDGRRCFKGQTGHWSSLGSLGVAGRCLAAVANGHGSKFQPHTAAGYQMLSRTGQALGLYWAPTGENPQVVNGLLLAHRRRMHKFNG